MPSRVIRDELLDSWRWHAISHEAARFYLALLLMADDFGLLNMSSLALLRRQTHDDYQRSKEA